MRKIMIPEPISGSIWGKIVDTAINLVVNFLVHVVKIYSPVKIIPKMVSGKGNQEWHDISTIKIENRLNTNLYDVTIIGVSKDIFSIKVLSDNSPKGKTVEFMDINANHLIVQGQERKTGNYWWIFRIQKFTPHESLLLNVKIENRRDILFSLSRYSKIEVPIKERMDGAVSIPFQIGKVPKIK